MEVCNESEKNYSFSVKEESTERFGRCIPSLRQAVHGFGTDEVA